MLPSYSAIIIYRQSFQRIFLYRCLRISETRGCCLIEGRCGQGSQDRRHIIISYIFRSIFLLHYCMKLLALCDIIVNYFDGGVLIQIIISLIAKSTLFKLRLTRFNFETSSLVVRHIWNAPDRRFRFLIEPLSCCPCSLKGIGFDDFFDFALLFLLVIRMHWLKCTLIKTCKIAWIVFEVDA